MALAYVGLGSNLGQPEAQVSAASQVFPDSTVLARSSLYRSRAIGPPGQPDYINAVILLRTALSPRQLLCALQAREQVWGRVRARPWGARTLDLDILLYDNVLLREPDLVIPHPQLARRNFVLLPLQELAPALQVPELGTVSELLATCPSNPITKLDDTGQGLAASCT